MRAVEDAWTDEGFSNFDATPFEVVVSGADGEILDRSGEIPTEAWSGRTILTFAPEGLVNGNTYNVELRRGDESESWIFHTGETGVVGGPLQLDVRGSAYYASRDSWTCCPEEFIGQCPNCSVTGTNYVPALRARFALLDHPHGPAGYSYTLQTLVDAPGSMWVDVNTQAFSEGEGTLSLVNERLINDRNCIRVLATPIDEDLPAQTSDPVCFDVADYGERPAFESRDEPLDCESWTDPDDDITDPDDDITDPDDDITDPDDDITDPDDDEDTDDPDQQPGWNVTEGDPAGSIDRGCGCSSSRQPSLPGSALLLLFGWVLARRRRPAR